MKKQDFYLPLLLSLLSFTLQAQQPSRFQRICSSEKGFYIGLGAMGGQMLNSNFGEALKRRDIGLQPGFTLEFAYSFAPLTLNLTAFSSRYKIAQIEDFAPEEGVIVRHTGGELGLSVSCLHLTRHFIPFVGAGYQLGNMGSGIRWLGLIVVDESVATEDRPPVHIKTMYAPVLKLGFNLNFGPRFGLRAEYRRSLISDVRQPSLGFNQLSVLLNFHPSMQ